MVVLHIPHASRRIPALVRPQFTIPQAALEEELLHMTDHATERLFAHPDLPAVVFPVSRLVVDPERFALDAEEPMAAQGMGVIYTHGSAGTRIRRDLSPEERASLLAAWYEPHHARLAALVDAALAGSAGGVLIVDCHSFASRPLPYEPDQRPDRPEICLGTDPYHTPAGLTDRAGAYFAGRGYHVAVNRPYGGTMVPAPHYRRDPRVHSIMIEVRRDLYADESTGLPHEGFERVHRDLRGVLEELD